MNVDFRGIKLGPNDEGTPFYFYDDPDKPYYKRIPDVTFNNVKLNMSDFKHKNKLMNFLGNESGRVNILQFKFFDSDHIKISQYCLLHQESRQLLSISSLRHMVTAINPLKIYHFENNQAVILELLDYKIPNFAGSQGIKVSRRY